ncbi:MAG: DUF6527 family protein [Bacillota bacterium]
MFKRLINFIFQKDRFKTVIIAEPGKSIEIPSKTLVLTKKGTTFTWVRYKCPCGCGELISLSLSPVISPYWSIVTSQENSKKQKVTITPSVYMRNTKCCSHYFITENKVIWCK